MNVYGSGQVLVFSLCLLLRYTLDTGLLVYIGVCCGFYGIMASSSKKLEVSDDCNKC